MYPEVISSDFGLFSPVFSTDSPLLTEQLHGLTEFEELPKDIFLSNEAEEIAELDTKEALKPLLPVHNDGDDDDDDDGDGDGDGDGVKAMEMEMMDAYVSNMSMGLITTLIGHGDGNAKNHVHNNANLRSGHPTSINGSMLSPPHLAGHHHPLPPLSPRFIPSSNGPIPSPNSAKPVATSILNAFCPTNTNMMPIPPPANHCTDKNALVADISFADHDACHTIPDISFAEHDACRTIPDISFTDHDACRTIPDISFAEHDACRTILDISFTDHDACRTAPRLLLPPLGGDAAASPICCSPAMMMMMQRRSHSSHDLGRLMRASYPTNHYDNHNWMDASMSIPTPYIIHELNINAMGTQQTCPVGRNLMDSDPSPRVGPASRLPSEQNLAPRSNDSSSDRLITRFSGVPSMRRVHSAGDIEAVLLAQLYGGGNNALPMERGSCSPTRAGTEEVSVTMGPRIAGHCTQEERKEKLYRYRLKRNERNFTKKIKYACRKSLADSRPRIRGRFARTDEPEEEPTVSCGKKHAASGHITLAEDCRNSCTNQHAGPSGFLSKEVSAFTGYTMANNANPRFWMNVAI